MATRATHGLLDEGYQQIIKELEDTQNQWLILKQYYLEVKEILHQTNFLELKDKEDFEAGVKTCLADLEREKCTVLIAGETSAGKSSLINLLLNERVLPSSVRQNTLTICEISYGPEKEAVLHFHDQSKPASILKGEEFEKQMKTYIQKSTEDKDWCEKIEIRLPNTLLKGGIVIVDSPGIGDTENIASIVMKYLPQANAFIYVINSSNAGGLHEDRLLRILSEWKKLYDGREESGITYESALFICNKWDLVEEEDDENEGKELEKEIISKLRERIPLLDEECQVVKMSVKKAAKELLNSGEMNDDLYSLICGIKDLLPRFAKMKAALLYFWISGQLTWLFHHAKVEMKRTQRDRKECLKARDELKVILKKLKQGSHIQEIEDTISYHVEDLCKKLTSHLRTEDVRKTFCEWSETELPPIGHRHSAQHIKDELGRCIDRRLDSVLQTLEKREKLFEKARANLESKFARYFSDLQKGIDDIDRVLEDSDDEFCPPEWLPARGRLPSYAKMKKIFVAAGVVFIPVLIPVGLAAGALFAPVFGYMAVDRYLKEQQLRNEPCQVLKELSLQFIESFIKDDLRKYVRNELTNEKNQISQIKRCHSEIITRYQRQSEALKRKADKANKLSDGETLEEQVVVDLYWKLQSMNQNLLFDAIQNGVPVMYPTGQIDGKKLSCNEENVLRRGRSAIIYKGTLNGKSVAVKRLQEEHHPRNIAFFLEEAGILTRVAHQNIVTFHGVSMNVQDGQLISVDLILELCVSSLKDRIFKEKRFIPWMTEDAAVHILQYTLHILQGLEFLHSIGIVHRDIKLSSMLISKDNFVKIADLGWAKSESLITGTRCGTPLHMAPEVREGNPYGCKADIFSFGVMMWEMWYGQSIFSDLISKSKGIPHPKKIGDYLAKPPGRDGTFAPPVEWTKVMISCCSPDPGKRPSATECKKIETDLSQYEK